MPILDTKALANTYDPPSRSGWEAIELWQEASSKPDNWGSARVAAAINRDSSTEFEGISRSAVRAWVDNGGMPDAARGVETARDLGWDAGGWTDTIEALATLVIGIYAFGSITKRHFVPSWSPDDEESRSDIEDALVWAGVGYQHVERDDPSQGDEIKPAQHASVLGRALVVAGAPVGGKNADSVHGLPAWVEDAPRVVQMQLAVLFVRGRGVKQAGKGTRQIQTDRGPRYFEDVAGLIERVTGETVTASEDGVTISADAVRELGLA